MIHTASPRPGIPQSPQRTLPGRFLLPNVPRVGFYQGGACCPRNVPFPACLSACLEFLGEGWGHRLIAPDGATWRLDNTYTYLMGVSGCAFRHSWGPGWQGDNIEIIYMSNDPAAPFVHAFEAAGYTLELIDPQGRHDDEALYRETIIRSLRGSDSASCRSRPVIAFGIIGPPESCLVTGYDENGDVLMGWNFFQDLTEWNAGVEFEATGEFRKRDWFASTRSLLVLGEKADLPPRGTLYRRALQWALQVMRTPVTFGVLGSGERHNGLAAYQAWADHLLLDTEFPTGDLSLCREHFMIHDAAVGMVAEGRWYAARFMEQITESEPALEADLLAAASCFDAEHDLMWACWELVGGNGRSDEHVRRLADPVVRRAIVDLVLKARDRDAEAAGWIEQALSR